MSDYQPEHGFAALSQVEAYWEALRGGQLVPKRSEVDPRGIEHALEYAFVLERIAPGIARLRIAGSHLGDLMGMEVRGMPLTAFFAPAARRRMSDLLEEMFQGPAIVDLRLSSLAVSGTTTPARLILLPLQSDLGDVSRALGCLVAQGDLGHRPLRFQIDAQTLRQLRPGTAMVATTSPALRPPKPPAPSQVPAPLAKGFAAPETAFEGRKPGGKRLANRRPPYLRLVKSDESEPY